MSIKTYSKSVKKESKNKGSVNKKITGHESYSVPNYGGGYSLQSSPEDCLERFLILGTAGAKYHIGAAKANLTEENTKNIRSLIKSHSTLVLHKIKEVSVQKRAISNDPAIYALALCAAYPDKNVRSKALDLLPIVCRTGTHLFHFAELISGMRGWGRGLRTAIGDWYLTKDFDSLVYQTLKYRQRDGWSVKDLIILSHPKTNNKLKNSLFNYIVNGNETIYNDALFSPESKGAKQIVAFIEISKWKEDEKSKNQKSRLIDLILFSDLTHEMIPTWYKNEPEVQEALLQKMPLMATIRQINAMTASGLIAPFSKATKTIVDRITDSKIVSKAGIHPLQVLVASRVYNQGRGIKGQLTWKPDPKISAALEETFELAFKSAPATGKNFMISVDVSGSMAGQFQEFPIRYCEVAACIALTMVKREPNTYTMCFSNKLNVLNLTEKDTLKSATDKALRYNVGTTNAGLPIEYAINNKLDVDAFLHITDADFNSGKSPLTLTEEFRRKMNKPKTRLMSVGLVAQNYSTVGFAQESDPYSMDILGFDSSIPTIINKFCSDSNSAPVVEEEE